MNSLQSEVNSCSQQLEPYMEETIKTEMTVSNNEISKYKCDFRDQISTEESCTKHHFDQSSKLDCRAESAKSSASKDHEDDVKLCRSEQTNCGLRIKKEESQAEDYAYYNQKEQFETYTDETIKIEETVMTWGISKYECNRCDGIFTDKSSLEHHFNEYHQGDLDEEPVQTVVKCESFNFGKSYFKCEHIGCKRSFKFMSGLKDHMVVHSDERRFKCEHPACTRSFKLKKELKRHLVVHSDERPFKCEHFGCKKSFKSKRELVCHTKVVHGDGKLLTSKHNGGNSDESTFKCHHLGCTKSFKTKSSLRLHTIVHNNEKPFACDQSGCIKSFRSKANLRMHMLVHTDKKPFKCPHIGCPMSFKAQNILNYHMRCHKDEKQFKCVETGCEKLFRTNSDLKIHMLIHNNEKLFKCHHAGCKKSFKTQGGLNKHMKVHCDVKPFKCEHSDCSKTFKRKDALRVHNLKHNNGKIKIKSKVSRNKVGCNETSSRLGNEELTVKNEIFLEQNSEIG